jgi:hypothetical protein
MKKEFSFYEFVGVISPGMVCLMIVAYVIRYEDNLINICQLSVGGFGFIVIVAYFVGHLIQSVGNLFETVWWKLFGGMPTSWIVKRNSCGYLSKCQVDALEGKMSNLLNLCTITTLSNYTTKEWYAITRQIYAAVKQEGASERLDIFNGNYGFFRGIAASLLMGILILIIFNGITEWRSILIVTIFFFLALARMHRFGKHYARELFVQFLQIKEPSFPK